MTIRRRALASASSRTGQAARKSGKTSLRRAGRARASQAGTGSARPGRGRAGLAEAALAAIGAFVLAACGGSAGGGTASGGGGSPLASRSASAIVSQMKSAVRDASSMHMDGRLTDSGKPVGLNMSLLRDGGLAGIITQENVPLSLIGADGKIYVRATRAFLAELHAEAVCSLMCGKWVQMSGPQADQLTGSLSMANLTKSLTTGLPSFRKDGMTTVSGQQAIELRAGDGATLDVAAQGKPYPLRVVAPSGQQGSVIFSQWDKVAAPKAPPSSEVINIDKLKAGLS